MNDLLNFPVWIRVEGFQVLVHNGTPLRVINNQPKTGNLPTRLARRFGRRVQIGMWQALDKGVFSADITV